MSWFKSLVIILCVSSTFADFKKSFFKENCDYSYKPTCLKLEIVTWLEKINEEDSYDLLPGLTVVRQSGTPKSNNVDILQDLARDFPDNPEARLDAFILKKAAAYINSHKIQIENPENSTDDNETSRQLGGGGGGGGKPGGGGNSGMRYILAAAAMMKGTLYALALKMVAMVAGKALMTGMIALVLSGIIGLKTLTSQGDKHSTYEVIAKPIHYDEHGGGYRRSYIAELGHGLPAGLQPGYSPS